jgi:membrane-associated phospholipid phosphatase
MRLQLPASSRNSPWFQQIAARVVLLWPLKAFGTMAFMALFFWGYFAVLEYPLAPPVTMPVLALDAWIPFTPLAFPVYVSLWVYVSLPPALLGSLRSLLGFGAWIAALCLFCLGLFWLWPTAVPMPDIDWQQYPQMAVIKGIDAGGNACPSLHVGSAVFAACWLARLLRNIGAPVLMRWLNWTCCVLIVWSTVATRQHVVLDVVAGVLVGLLFALPSLRHVGRRDGVSRL